MGFGTGKRMPLWAFIFTICCIQQKVSSDEGISGRVNIIPPITTPVITSFNRAHNGRVCSTWGHFHFRTFDGDMFHFPGLCNYVFASHCHTAFEDFNIQIRRTLVEESAYINYITMRLDGVDVQLEEDSAMVNAERVELPYSGAGFLIEKSITHVTINVKLGLNLMWNVKDSLILELDEKYINQTCGLCGDFNGIPNYNEFVSNGVHLTDLQFGNMQKLNGPTEECEDPVPSPLNNCTDVYDICRQVLTGSAFSQCNEVVWVHDYIDICEQDLCLCNDSDNFSCLCQTFAEYSRQCDHAGGQPGNWRTPELCPMKCPFNMEYQECGSPCMDTCTNSERSQLCEDHCMDGCFCPLGTVYDDISGSGCVPHEQCSCIYNGKSYAPGATYSEPCRSCFCAGGQWECTDIPCPGICSVEGGSHISTYDEKHYDVHGDCTYVLSKACDDNLFTVLGELRRCGLTETETCLKMVTLNINGGETNVVIKPDGDVFLNWIYTQLPISAANVTIFKPSSFYIIVQTTFGLQLVMQLTPMMQVYIHLDPSFKERTCGLCGNFDSRETDDFKVLSGVVEGTAATFANTWKTQAACPNIKHTFEDPCTLSIENEKYANHWCGLLTDSEGPFAACHSAVNVAPYHKNCMFDTCNCERSEDCMCAALSSYVRACAAKNIELPGWRTTVCTKYTTCPQSLNYSYAISSCQSTCRSLSEPDVTCNIKFVPVDGCTCQSGTYLDSSGKCVPAQMCPCYYKGNPVLSGEVLHDLGAVCTCSKGKLNCIGGGGDSKPTCVAPMVYFDCKNTTAGTIGAECQKSCQTLDMHCYSTQCVSGCMCPTGLVSDGKGGCIPMEDCPCVHNDVTYKPGEKIKVDCNTCVCKDRMWKCTKNKCLSTCAVYGDGHYITFDDKRYIFSGKCEYTLVQDHCGQNSSTNGTFRVITENIPCGTTGTTCSKSIKIFLGTDELILSEEHHELIQRGEGNHPLPYRIRYMGIYLVIETYNGLIILWDKKTSIFIKLSADFKGQVCGLCGNYDGSGVNDFTTRSQSVVGNVLEFGNSWKVSPTCPDAKCTKDPCAKNPYRKSWSQKQCSIINSKAFATCHSHVDPTKYYESCVTDSCACDAGGDCECFCTAVAAYAQACSEFGVCITWRSPAICPLFCDYYNAEGECDWHYKPCGAPCMKTCRNPSGRCLHHLPGLEGCYPHCPPEKPYFNEDEMKCVSVCGCYDGQGEYYPPGAIYDSGKTCQTCQCTNKGIECSYDAKACYCYYEGKTYIYRDVIYNTTDGLGWCMIATCDVNGTINREVYKCGGTTPTTPFTFTTVSATTSSGTEATTPSTTSCVHMQCEWTEWYDVSYPKYSENKGDYETPQKIREKGYNFCKIPDQVECRAKEFPNEKLEALNQKVTCSKTSGLICINEEQFPPICYNYEIRFFCCEYKPCSVITTVPITSITTETTPAYKTTTTTSTTTPQGSTTAVTTPVVSTTSGQSTPPASTAGSTPVPLVSTTTQRTTVVSTTAVVTALVSTPGTTPGKVSTVTATSQETTPISKPTATIPTSGKTPGVPGTTTTTLLPPSSTTKCQPRCKWTAWFDNYYPSSDPKDGDKENHDTIQAEGGQLCDKPQDIECRAEDYPDVSLEDLGQKVECNTQAGLSCLNAEQTGKMRTCHNYQARFLCCDDSHCKTATTPQGTTTAVTTPAVSTTSGKSSPPASTAGSTPVPLVSTTTQRTTVVSTTPVVTASVSTPGTTPGKVSTVTATSLETTPISKPTATIPTSGKTPGVPGTTTTTLLPPSSTTKCQPRCKWTAWFDNYYPSSDPKDGDKENHDTIQTDGDQLCDKPQDIECRAEDYPDVSLEDLGQKVECNTQTGLSCLNAEQTGKMRTCYNYQARFLCCDDSHCKAATTPQGTTTAVTTPAVTTTSGKSSPPATTAGSTPVPLVSTTTQRTTVVSTTPVVTASVSTPGTTPGKVSTVTSTSLESTPISIPTGTIPTSGKTPGAQGTTTAVTTPAVRTTSEKSTPPASTAGSTPVPLVSTTTQRTTVVSTTPVVTASVSTPGTTPGKVSTVTATSLETTPISKPTATIPTSGKTPGVPGTTTTTLLPPSSTTKCQPRCKWTAWFDNYYPSSDPKDGDKENHDTIQAEGGQLCDKPQDIECRAEDYPDVSLEDLGQKVECNTQTGLSCLNAEQTGKMRTCYNYQARFLCCDDSHCKAATTPQSTTTAVTTPAVTTTSGKSSPPATTAGSTPVPLVSTTTQRTTVVSTTPVVTASVSTPGTTPGKVSTVTSTSLESTPISIPTGTIPTSGKTPGAQGTTTAVTTPAVSTTSEKSTPPASTAGSTPVPLVSTTTQRTTVVSTTPVVTASVSTPGTTPGKVSTVPATSLETTPISKPTATIPTSGKTPGVPGTTTTTLLPPSSTTKCQPRCKWTAWFDNYYPSSDPKDGDKENHDTIQAEGGQLCDKPQDIECRAEDYPDVSLEDLGQKVECNTQAGLSCLNAEQTGKMRTCHNYQARFLCCDDSHCKTATTPQGTTTAVTTPAVSTTSGKSSPPASTAGSTPVPLVSTTTQRTTVVSTTPVVTASVSTPGTTPGKVSTVTATSLETTPISKPTATIPTSGKTPGVPGTTTTTLLPPSSTTKCQPQCKWTAWFDNYYPSSDPKDGDKENHDTIQTDGDQLCDKPQDIECRAEDYPDVSLEDLGQKVECNTQTGLSCLNAEQTGKMRTCYNYQARFLCCDDSHCKAATTPQGTTTAVTTPAVTTTSGKSSPPATTAGSTPVPLVSTTTQRTTVVSTTPVVTASVSTPGTTPGKVSTVTSTSLESTPISIPTGTIPTSGKTPGAQGTTTAVTTPAVSTTSEKSTPPASTAGSTPVPLVSTTTQRTTVVSTTAVVTASVSTPGTTPGKVSTVTATSLETTPISKPTATIPTSGKTPGVPGTTTTTLLPPSSTTKCQPRCKWTAWFDNYYPSSNPKDGDKENHDTIQAEGGQLCDKPQDIECRAEDYPDVSLEDLGQKVECNTQAGLSCLNAEQTGKMRTCHNYQARFLCCDDSHCKTATTPQGTTTAVTTPAVTTTSGKSSPPATTAGSTPVPLVSTTTQRTTVVSTTPVVTASVSTPGTTPGKVSTVTSTSLESTPISIPTGTIPTSGKTPGAQGTTTAVTTPAVSTTSEKSTPPASTAGSTPVPLVSTTTQRTTVVSTTPVVTASVSTPGTTPGKVSTVTATSLETTPISKPTATIPTSGKTPGVPGTTTTTLLPPSSTTKCQPRCKWTAWFDNYYPSSDPKDGDKENHDTIQAEGGQLCDKPQDIECRAEDYPDVSLEDLGQKVECNTQAGLSCLNAEQTGKMRTCHNYQARFLCCDDSHCKTATTPQGTTTAVTTPAVSTTSGKSSPPASTAGSTPVPLVSTTTQRTTVVSTTPVVTASVSTPGTTPGKVSTVTATFLETTPISKPTATIPTSGKTPGVPGTTTTTLLPPSSTTKCQPQCKWTAWFDNYYPSSDPKDGDKENHDTIQTDGDQLCDKPQDIECRAEDYPDVSLEDLGQKVECNTQTGLSCLNAEQTGKMRTCYNYQARFLCCDDSHCKAATTPQGTTTAVTTPAVTTTSGKSSPPATTAGSTPVPLVSTTTQRTTVVSTTPVVTASVSTPGTTPGKVSTVTSTSLESTPISIPTGTIPTSGKTPGAQGTTTAVTTPAVRTTSEKSTPPASTAGSTPVPLVSTTTQRTTVVSTTAVVTASVSTPGTTPGKVSTVTATSLETTPISKPTATIPTSGKTPGVPGTTTTTLLPPSSTTKCQPRCKWTAWFDNYYPSSNPKDGDKENHDTIQAEGGQLCDKPQDIECRAEDYPDVSLEDLGQKVECNTQAGLSCLNAEQTGKMRTCYNYQARFLCCDDSHCKTATTPQGTTTAVTTPAVSTTSGKSSPPASTAGSTPVPLVSTTTQRTTVVSTTPVVTASVSTPGTTPGKVSTVTATSLETTPISKPTATIPTSGKTPGVPGTTTTTLLPPSSTTKCQPRCKWTAWFDNYYPSSDPKDGDKENHDTIQTDGEQLCDKPQDIECRAEDYPDVSLEDLGQKVECNTQTGLSCLNAEQTGKMRTCYNYQARFLCCDDSHCKAATTPQGTTTAVTTPAVTTTSGKSSPPATTAGSTPVPLVSTTTQRTTVVSTTPVVTASVSTPGTTPGKVSTVTSTSLESTPISIPTGTIPTSGKTPGAQGTTTAVTTPAVSTTSEKSTPPASTAGSTPVPLVPTTTQRTTVVSTTPVVTALVSTPGTTPGKVSTVTATSQETTPISKPTATVPTSGKTPGVPGTTTTTLLPPSSTTKCQPRCKWTAWFDNYYPSSDQKDGDKENHDTIQADGGQLCDKPQDIECRAEDYPDVSLEDLGQKIECNTQTGLSCLNAEQTGKMRTCYNYQARFLCCDDSHCKTATTPQGTTTAVTTPAVSTTSGKSSPPASTAGSTPVPLVSTTTQKTTVVSTTPVVTASVSTPGTTPGKVSTVTATSLETTPTSKPTATIPTSGKTPGAQGTTTAVTTPAVSTTSEKSTPPASTAGSTPVPLVSTTTQRTTVVSTTPVVTASVSTPGTTPGKVSTVTATSLETTPTSKPTATIPTSGKTPGAQSTTTAVTTPTVSTTSGKSTPPAPTAGSTPVPLVSTTTQRTTIVSTTAVVTASVSTPGTTPGKVSTVTSTSLESTPISIPTGTIPTSGKTPGVPGTTTTTLLPPSSTTKCQPRCKWTAWFDNYYPSSDPKDGDKENHDTIQAEGGQLCDKPQDIECRAEDYPDVSLEDLGQKVECNTQTGLSCLNAEQTGKMRTCYNYQARFRCCDDSHCKIATTPQGTTTAVTTPAVTTTSGKSTPPASTAGSTPVPLVSTTTQRTTGVSTTPVVTASVSTPGTTPGKVPTVTSTSLESTPISKPTGTIPTSVKTPGAQGTTTAVTTPAVSTTLEKSTPPASTAGSTPVPLVSTTQRTTVVSTTPVVTALVSTPGTTPGKVPTVTSTSLESTPISKPTGTIPTSGKTPGAQGTTTAVTTPAVSTTLEKSTPPASTAGSTPVPLVSTTQRTTVVSTTPVVTALVSTPGTTPGKVSTVTATSLETTPTSKPTATIPTSGKTPGAQSTTTAVTTPAVSTTFGKSTPPASTAGSTPVPLVSTTTQRTTVVSTTPGVTSSVSTPGTTPGKVSTVTATSLETTPTSKPTAAIPTSGKTPGVPGTTTTTLLPPSSTTKCQPQCKWTAWFDNYYPSSDPKDGDKENHDTIQADGGQLCDKPQDIECRAEDYPDVSLEDLGQKVECNTQTGLSCLNAEQTGKMRTCYNYQARFLCCDESHCKTATTPQGTTTAVTTPAVSATSGKSTPPASTAGSTPVPLVSTTTQRTTVVSTTPVVTASVSTLGTTPGKVSTVTATSLETTPTSKPTATIPTSGTTPGVPGTTTTISLPTASNSTPRTSQPTVTISIATSSSSFTTASTSSITPTVGITTVTLSRTTPCFCHVSGVEVSLYSPGEMIYNRTDSAGCSFYAICNKDCEIERHQGPCPSTPPPQPSTLIPSVTPPGTAAVKKTTESHATTSPVLTTSEVPGCTDIEPPRKINETWMLSNCTMATCEGNNRIVLVPQPPPEKIECASGLEPVKIEDRDGCPHYECECICTGSESYHYMTFDGTFYSFHDNCTYILVKEIVNKHDDFSVLVDNYFCDPTNEQSCSRAIVINYNSVKITLSTQMHNGVRTNMILYDNKPVHCVNCEIGGIMISNTNTMVAQIPAIGAFVTYNGLAFSVELPYSTFEHNTEGQCGTCSNDRSDDCRLPSGHEASSCSAMAIEWQIYDKNKPYCEGVKPTPTPTPVSPTPTICTTPSPLCELIVSDIFADCHKVLPPRVFYEDCLLEACHSANDSLNCHYLEMYASLCTAKGACTDWRSKTQGKCPYNCPKDKVYDACGTVPAVTCSDGPTEDTSVHVSEGCFCSDNKILFNSYTDICVSECGCVGPDGLPKLPGSTWKSNCQECVCDPLSVTVQCKPQTCKTTETPTCEKEGFIAVPVVTPEDPCCPEIQCKCNTSACSNQKKSCEPGYELASVLFQGDCCVTFTCERIPNICLVNETVYKPGTTVPSKACETCICSDDTDPASKRNVVECTAVQCDTTCTEGHEYQVNAGECCGKCVQVACVINHNGTTELLKPGDIWHPKTNNCTFYECEEISDTFVLVKTVRKCPTFDPKECGLVGVEMTSDGCCQKCKPQPPSCKLHKNQTLVRSGDCLSTEVVDMTYCEGVCLSSAVYSDETRAMQHKCTCCQETKSHRRELTLTCRDGRSINYDYIYVEECQCTTACIPQTTIS